MDAVRKRRFIWQCNDASWLTEKDEKKSILSVSRRIDSKIYVHQASCAVHDANKGFLPHIELSIGGRLVAQKGLKKNFLISSGG